MDKTEKATKKNAKKNTGKGRPVEGGQKKISRQKNEKVEQSHAQNRYVYWDRSYLCILLCCIESYYYV